MEEGLNNHESFVVREGSRRFANSFDSSLGFFFSDPARSFDCATKFAAWIFLSNGVSSGGAIAGNSCRGCCGRDFAETLGQDCISLTRHKSNERWAACSRSVCCCSEGVEAPCQRLGAHTSHGRWWSFPKGKGETACRFFPWILV